MRLETSLGRACRTTVSARPRKGYPQAVTKSRSTHGTLQEAVPRCSSLPYKDSQHDTAVFQ